MITKQDTACECLSKAIMMNYDLSYIAFTKELLEKMKHQTKITLVDAYCRFKQMLALFSANRLFDIQ